MEELNRELEGLVVANQYEFRGIGDLRIGAYDSEDGAQVEDLTESLPMAPLFSELYGMPLLAALEQLHHTGTDLLGDLDLELAAQLASNYGLKTLPLFGSREARRRTLEEGDRRAIVLNLSGIEVVDEAELTWEQVRRLRANGAAVSNFRAVALWDGGPASLEHLELQKGIPARLASYRDALDRFQLPRKAGVVEIAWDPGALSDAPGVAGDRWGEAASSGSFDFEVEEVHVSVSRDNLASPPTTCPPYLGLVYGSFG